MQHSLRIRNHSMNEQTAINQIKGVGEKTTLLFEKLGIHTVGDLMRYYPRSYDIYEEPVCVNEVEEGRIATVSGILYGKVQVSGNRRLLTTTAYVKDMTGTLKLLWFRMPFLKNTLSKGGKLTVRGLIVRGKQGLLMEHPQLFYPSEQYEEKLHTMQPVYGLTTGLSNNMIIKAVKQALHEIHLSQETLDEQMRLSYELAEYNYAIRGIHFPEDKGVFFYARKRLVFEEFLEFIIALQNAKDVNERSHNNYKVKTCDALTHFVEALPYQLTKSQKKVWKEIQEDLQKDTSMSRLVQGDVGSGKTIVALLALMTIAFSGYQGAMMAPTEVLARQHFESIQALFRTHHIHISLELLTGSMTAKQKREAYERIQSGVSQIIIGTHALIQEKVSYKNLALVVTDEQHRFGVRQREYFSGKGDVPHVLVMSATPIPRTLAIIVYGDLDVSAINELPANRLPIKNCVVDSNYREKAYSFMQAQVLEGRQCYVVCPMVEESEHLEVENVIDYAQSLTSALNDHIQIEYLHGRMKQTEKDAIMERFAKNETQILVSTTVIEVGINVPNATVMVVENAERFGLAQLHQLRGRVGRGIHQSYCIFMSASKSKETKLRLNILNTTNDGFKIASEDLKLRGPGDLFGIRQSGLMDFKIGDVFQDAEILQMASEAAKQIKADETLWKTRRIEGNTQVIL